jgi:hypothetical protein
VHVSVRAAPASSELFLDGAPLGTNPYVSTRARDTTPRQLVVRAKGYKERVVPVVLDHDVDLVLELAAATPEPRGPAPRVERPAPAPRSTPSAAPTSTGRTPRRTIEEDDPYHR